MAEMGFVPEEALQENSEALDLKERVEAVKAKIEQAKANISEKVTTFKEEKKLAFTRAKAATVVGVGLVLSACGGEAQTSSYTPDEFDDGGNNSLYENAPEDEYTQFMEENASNTNEAIYATPISTLPAAEPVSPNSTEEIETIATPTTSPHDHAVEVAEPGQSNAGVQTVGVHNPEGNSPVPDVELSNQAETLTTREQAVVAEILAKNEVNGYIDIPESYTPENLVNIANNQELLEAGIKFAGPEGMVQLDERAVPYVVDFLLEAQEEIEEMGFGYLKVTHGYRTHGQQQGLYNSGATTAEGTESHHRTGLAFDVFVMRETDVVAANPGEIEMFTAALFDLAEDQGILHTLPWDTPHYVVADALGEGTAQMISESAHDPDLVLSEVFQQLYGNH